MPKNPDQDKLIAEIKKADNILVALSANPTIDELASALGLTLMLNKNKRRAVAIFSGQIPDALGFLKMSETFDVNADGLRDFIVTLDAKKADRVVCKAEDGMVKVYITPSGSIVNSKDLEFSQGDYNVDLVIGVGVSRKEDLDQALTAHGRILHSASVVSLMIGNKTSELGSLNIRDTKASSYAEILFDLEKALDANLAEGEEPAMDQAVATAFLTGLVAVTDRFSNNKTTAEVMTLVAELMKLGANQQLVANELAKTEIATTPQVTEKSSKTGTDQEVDLQLDRPSQTPESTTLDLKSAKTSQTQEVDLTPESPVDSEMVSEPEAVEKIKPTLDNLEAYNAQQMEAERAEVAKEIITRLEQEAPAVTEAVAEQPPIAEVLPVVETPVVQDVPVPVSQSESVVSEPAAIMADDQLAEQLEQVVATPADNLINRFNDTVITQPVTPPPTVTNPDPNIVFGHEVVESPAEAWSQSVNTNEPPVVTGSIAGARQGEKVIQPLEQSPNPVVVESVPQVPVATDLAAHDLPPLPDFSAFSVAPPMPPMPPSFETPVMPPQFDATALAQPIPEINPFDQFNQSLPQTPPQFAQSQPIESVSPVTHNPVMQDQVYPNLPPDKAQFIIPE